MLACLLSLALINPASSPMSLIATCTWKKNKEVKIFKLYAHEPSFKVATGNYLGAVLVIPPKASPKAKKPEISEQLILASLGRSREDSYFRFSDEKNYYDIQLRPALNGFALSTSTAGSDDMMVPVDPSKFSCKMAVKIPEFPTGGD